MHPISWSVTAPLSLIVGALLYRLVLGLSLWRIHREPAHVWAAVWCATAVAFVGGRLVQRVAWDRDDVVYVAVLAQYLGAISLLSASFVMAQTLGGEPPSRHVLRRLALATVAVVATFLAVFLAFGRLTRGFDAGGDPLSTVRLGPAALALVPVTGWVSVVGLRPLREARRERRVGFWLGAASTLAAVLGVNDALLAAGLVETYQVVQYGIALVLVVGGYMLSARTSERQKRLDDAIAARTRQLEGALDEVRRAEARLQMFADAAVAGLVVHDGASVRDGNAILARLTGLEPDTLRGRALASLFAPGSLAELRTLLAGDDTAPHRMDVVRGDGSSFPAEVHAVRRPAGGDGLGILALIDTSERDAMSRRLVVADRMASLGTLAAGAAHEINNPLSFVRLNLDHVGEEIERGALGDPRTPSARELLAVLEETRQGCDRIKRVVQDLRTLSRQDDAGGLRGAADLRTVAEMAVQMARHEIRHRARLMESYEEEALVEADEARLTQVCLNLLLNAVQALPPGNSDDHEIRVGVRRQGSSAILEVSDTGTGIAPEVLPHIFDPFFTTKPVGVGTGLGLSICHTIVTSVGGEIAVTSKVGAGTSFRVVLPLARTPSLAPRPPRRISSPNVSRGSILIVDDEESLARALARALKGCDVTVATSGRRAIAEVDEKPFDMVLCDLMMPDTGGVEVFEHLRRVHPALAGRFVLMTGGTVSDQARTALGVVAEQVLHKPVDMELLRRTVDRVLGGAAPS